MSHRLLTDEQEEYVSQQYVIGRNMQSLATEFNTNKTTIRNILRRRGVSSRIGKGYPTLNHNAFDLPSEERSYWIGFLLADGCIIEGKNRNPSVQLALGPKDIGHIIKLADFCNLPLPKNPTKLAFTSVKIVRLLMSFGIVPRKSGKETIPNEFFEDRNFWRGLIDGDGWISKDREIIGICGSYDVCKSFCNYADIICNAKINPTKIKTANCWVTSVNGPKAIVLIRHLYENSSISLERKRNAALNLINIRARKELKYNPNVQHDHFQPRTTP